MGYLQGRLGSGRWTRVCLSTGSLCIKRTSKMQNFCKTPNPQSTCVSRPALKLERREAEQADSHDGAEAVTQKTVTYTRTRIPAAETSTLPPSRIIYLMVR